MTSVDKIHLPGGKEKYQKYVVKRDPDELGESSVNHRDFASQGLMHPTWANHSSMKVGNAIDFYATKTGEKVEGKVIKNDGKNVSIKQLKGGVHNFAVKDTLPMKTNESVSPFDWKKYTAGRSHRDSLTGSTSTFHDVKKTSTGTVYTKQANPDGTNKGSGEDAAKAVAPEAAVKRGRGRPPGKYGSYKARSTETGARASALAAASKAKNRALRKEEFTEEFLDEIFSGMNVEGQVQFLLSDDYTQLDEISKKTLGGYLTMSKNLTK